MGLTETLLSDLLMKKKNKQSLHNLMGKENLKEDEGTALSLYE